MYLGNYCMQMCFPSRSVAIYTVYFLPTVYAEGMSEKNLLLTIMIPIIGVLFIICIILAALLCWFKCRNPKESCACCQPACCNDDSTDEFQYKDIQSEKQGAGYAGKKFKPHKNDLNRFVKHERTLTDNSGVINESVDIIEKDGRVKVMTPLPRDVSGSIDIEPTNVALTKANPIVSDLRNDNRERFFRGNGPTNERRIDVAEPSQFGETASIATTRTNISKFTARPGDQEQYIF